MDLMAGWLYAPRASRPVDNFPIGVDVTDQPSPKLAPGRYCLRICYCGQCPHHQPYQLTDAQRSRLLAYLTKPTRGPLRRALAYARQFGACYLRGLTL